MPLEHHQRDDSAPIAGLAKVLVAISNSERRGHRGTRDRAFCELLKLIKPRIVPLIVARLHATKFTGPEQVQHEVEDILQEFSLKVWGKVDSFPIGRAANEQSADEQATAWLLAMLENMIRDLTKTTRRRARWWTDLEPRIVGLWNRLVGKEDVGSDSPID